MRRPVVCIVALLLAAAPVRPDSTLSDVERIQEESATLVDQRAQLLRLARDSEAAAPEQAAAAWHAAGRAFEHEAQADSAIACYRKAIALERTMTRLVAAMDALFRRTGPGDAEEALGLAQQALAVGGPSSVPFHELQARLAWAMFLNGKTDDARASLGRLERALVRRPLWQLRMGRVALESGDLKRAFGMLLSVAMESRGQADDAMDMLRKVSGQLGSSGGYEDQLRHELAVRDRQNDRLVQALGGRRLMLEGADRFPLGGTLLAAPGTGRHGAVVAMIAPEDSLDSWDSLAVRLRNGGLSILLLDARGTGYSVGRSCPLATSWEGRRGSLVQRSAEDPAQGLRGLAKSTRSDTTHYTLIAEGTMASAALAAAERDPRVREVVLVSPNVDPVERGPARASLRRSRVPLYITQTRIDQYNELWTEPLYQAAPEGISRLTEAPGSGSGPESFRSDSTATDRLMRWMREKKPPRATAGPPRGARR